AERFQALVRHGQEHMNDECEIDYFAVSLPDLAIWDDDLNKLNQIHCHYVIGLGNLGLGKISEARERLEKVLEMDVAHIGANWFVKMAKHFRNK
ncbi:MAG: hypothetical protein ACK5L7_00075, partial [Paludibacteraceae bacterium]